MKWISFMLFLLAEVVLADPLAKCMKEAKVSETEFSGQVFTLRLKYCSTKHSDGTEDYIVISTDMHYLGRTFRVPSSEVNLRTFPRNRCDYLKVSVRERDFFLGLGRISKNCRTSEFGQWKYTEHGAFDTPVVLLSPNAKPKHFLVSQSWR